MEWIIFYLIIGIVSMSIGGAKLGWPHGWEWVLFILMVLLWPAVWITVMVSD